MKEGFSGYHIRGKFSYELQLFSDDITGSPFADRIVKGLSQRWGIASYSDFEFFGLHGTLDDQFKTFTAEDVREKFGGKKEFFKKGARILDLGSKSGLVTIRFTDKKRDISVIGLDEHYSHSMPIHPSEGSYVGGEEINLPFENDTFSGIMALRTFPDDVNNLYLYETETFEEITRVAKEGAVYRAIPPSGFLPLVNDEFKYTDKLRIINQLTINGWETFYSEDLLVAKLVEKPR